MIKHIVKKYNITRIQFNRDSLIEIGVKILVIYFQVILLTTMPCHADGMGPRYELHATIFFRRRYQRRPYIHHAQHFYRILTVFSIQMRLVGISTILMP